MILSEIMMSLKTWVGKPLLFSFVRNTNENRCKVAESHLNKKVSKPCLKVSYSKQIARQHSWSTVNKYSSHLVWSQRKNLVAVSHTVRAHVKGPKFFGDAGSLLHGWRPRNTPLPHVCHTKFRRSRSNCSGIRRGSQTIAGTQGPRPVPSRLGRGWP